MIAGLSTEPLHALGNHSVKHRWILQDGGPALQISDETSAKQQISGLETEEGGVRERMGTSGWHGRHSSYIDKGVLGR